MKKKIKSLITAHRGTLERTPLKDVYYDKDFKEFDETWNVKKLEELNNDKQMTVPDFEAIKSYILSRDKALLEQIKSWCKKRCKDNITVHGTDKWNGDLEDLIDFLY